MTPDFWYALLFALAIWLVLWAASRWLLPRFGIGNAFVDMTEAELRKHIADLEKRLIDSENKGKELDLRLNDSEKRNQELQSNQQLLLDELRKANIEVDRQKTRVSELSSRVNELERNQGMSPATTKPKIRRVLGVWPTAPKLDQASEKDAIFSAGFEYEVLAGTDASRMGIVLELERSQYNIMEIGARGGAGGILLADGMAPPGWWLQLARQHNIEIFVVLANQSSAPGVINVADALYTAGVKAVISVDSSIEDADAIKFARILYQRLSQNVSLANAVNFAKLVLTDAGSETIRLRER